MDAHPLFKAIWKSRCTPRIKFFFWLVLADRLNTKSILLRRHFHPSDGINCVMCPSATLETVEHLFFECQFAQQCWDKLQINWDLASTLLDRFFQARAGSQIPMFTEVVSIAAWELWKIRNDRVFNRGPPSIQLWICNFRSQCLLQSVRFKDDFRSSFCVWLDAFS